MRSASSLLVSSVSESPDVWTRKGLMAGVKKLQGPDGSGRRQKSTVRNIRTCSFAFPPRFSKFRRGVIFALVFAQLHRAVIEEEPRALDSS